MPPNLGDSTGSAASRAAAAIAAMEGLEKLDLLKQVHIVRPKDANIDRQPLDGRLQTRFVLRIKQRIRFRECELVCRQHGAGMDEKYMRG